MEPIKNIIVVDDHDIFREGLVALLTLKKIAVKVYEAKNGEEFIDLLTNITPELVLLDISMPLMDGLTAAKVAIDKYPDIKILVLSMFGDQEYYYKMISVGVKGFVLKSAGKNELEQAIQAVAKGDSYFSNELLRKIIADIGYERSKPEKPDFDITNREFEVLKWFCQGYSASEIAEEMLLSKKTIEGYRTKLFQKTGTKTSLSLVVFAIKNKLVNIT